MKYALVTGGSRGIGQAVCLKLAEMGYHILINYQSNDTEAEATLQQIREQGSDGELMKFETPYPSSFKNLVTGKSSSGTALQNAEPTRQ